MHSDTQIRPFDMRSRNTGVVRSADFDVWDRSQNVSAPVPVITANLAIDFMKLAEIHVAPEVLSHRPDIAVVLVGCDLIAAIGALAKVADKGMGVDAVPRPDVMANKQFGFRSR